MRIAIVHDWLTGMRGGEKLLLELIRMFPSADVYTLFWRRGSVAGEIEERVKGVSFLQRLPFAESAYRYYLPLFPWAARSLDLTGYDFVLSSSHAVAKGASVSQDALHVCYMHTPMRYLWENRAAYFQFGRGRWWKRAALELAVPYLRRFDLRTAARVDYFVANSENVRRRILRAYRREAIVIPPPVDTDFFTPADSEPHGDYYLVASPLEPYKRIDLAVDAFSAGGRRLLIAGDGTMERELRRRAHPPVEFLGRVSDSRLRDLYRHCRALVFPGLEDFGLTPVEAQACGRPVVCFGQGGAIETVVDGVTGVYFPRQTVPDLLHAVERLEAHEWDSVVIRRQSLRFSRQRFYGRMKAFWHDELAVAYDFAA